MVSSRPRGVGSSASRRAAYYAMAEGAVLVDTRYGDDRRATGVIPGSVHVPLSVLFWRLDPSSGNDDPALSDLVRPEILICAHGYSSSLAAASLRELGFARVGDVIGGFEARSEAGLPVLPERITEAPPGRSRDAG